MRLSVLVCAVATSCASGSRPAAKPGLDCPYGTSAQADGMPSNYREFRGPIACADNSIRTIFYVESDGRHLSAIGFDGIVRWTRNPGVDAHLEPRDVGSPRIVWMGKPEPSALGSHAGPERHFIAIDLDSATSGVVDVGTGTFTRLAQD